MSDVKDFNRLYLKTLTRLASQNRENAHSVLNVSYSAIDVLMQTHGLSALEESTICVAKAKITAANLIASAETPVHQDIAFLNFHFLCLIRHLAQTSSMLAIGLTGVSLEVCSKLKNMRLIELQEIANANSTLFEFRINETYLKSIDGARQKPSVLDTMLRYAVTLSMVPA